MGLQEEFYIDQMTSNHLFEPILNVVYETMPRDNLLNSVCLELFEFVKREQIKPIIIHVVKNYREKLEEITYVDTFQTLILRYDQMQGYSAEVDPTSIGQDSESTPQRTNVNGNQRWQGVKEMDPAEEAYFNTSDDEDEMTNKKRPGKGAPAVNGTSRLLKNLVDYPDDDEDMMDMKVDFSENRPSEAMRTAGTNESARPAPIVPSIPPLERVSEKRRREEDDEEDELGKLSHTKRRSSSGSLASSTGSMVGSNSGNVLRRKKSFTATSRDSSSDREKITIVLASKKGDAKSKGDNEG